LLIQLSLGAIALSAIKRLQRALSTQAFLCLMEEAMEALIRKKKEWEFQNQQVLLKLVQTSSDVSVESVKKAGLVTSFLFFLIYKTIRGMLALGALMIYAPRMVRNEAPGHQPLESHQFNHHHLESQLAHPIWRR
jgi:hypothetical protein